MWRLRKLRCLFPGCYDITWCLKSFLWLMTARGSITLGLCARVGKNSLWREFACVNLNGCSAPEVYHSLEGREDWVWALASVTLKWCVETCIPVLPMLLPGWLAGLLSHPTPLLGRVFELVHGGRTRCTRWDHSFLFQLGKWFFNRKDRSAGLKHMQRH